MLDKAQKVVGIVVGLLTIWQILASTTDLPVGQGPIAIVSQNDHPSPTVTTDTLPPPPPPREKLATPSGLNASGGDCDSGFTLSWESVDGAERYYIEQDGFRMGVTSETSTVVTPFHDGNEHRYRVIAHAFGQEDSDPSREVTLGPCSF